MRVAGYGRSLKALCVSESKEERDDDYGGIANIVHDVWMDFDMQAKKSGFIPITNTNFEQHCISTWKSTSSGMEPMKVDIIIDGVESEVTLRKKASVGALMGDKLFRRQDLSKKLDLKHPGKMGARDVPYKATRIIYPIRMATMNA